MGKKLYIAEKPSVAQEFAKALQLRANRRDGYLESDDSIVTWCVGHLVSMSYPEVYDPKLKSWRMDTIPFLPKEWKYEVIPSVKKQFEIVKELLNRPDVDVIYICTDSGREGEYIYRLVDQMAKVQGKERRRVWIDSQTEEEIRKGISQAKDWSCYDNLSASAYLRAKEDYLMGINFSRVLSLKFGPSIAALMNTKYSVVSVGRVMTCVLGMVVRREREIRAFVKSSFYRVLAEIDLGNDTIQAEWKAVEGSAYYQSPKLYKENGFKERKDAEAFIDELKKDQPQEASLVQFEKKKENKNPPLLFNLAELQNVCSKRFKISPDETLKIVQELYEKKMVTYPRTDARVLSTAVAKEIGKNIKGLLQFDIVADYAKEILYAQKEKGIEKTRYTNDKQITDHYAIIPTGQGINSYTRLSPTAKGIYEQICRRFLSIFYPAAVYRKYNLEFVKHREHFFAGFKLLEEEGYLKVAGFNPETGKEKEEDAIDGQNSLKNILATLKKGMTFPINGYTIKEGETSPPKRYNSGSLILAMENAGQLIEDEELRAQIKGSGIGTSATRAEILKKLVSIDYLNLNQKTQVVTPKKLGEAVYEVVSVSIRQLLNPEMTASWEKGLTYVAEGSITSNEYTEKMENYVTTWTKRVKQIERPERIQNHFAAFTGFYEEA